MLLVVSWLLVTAAADEPAHVRGVLRDVGLDEGVGGAVVHVDGAAATTADDGTFEVVLAPGSWPLSLDAPDGRALDGGVVEVVPGDTVAVLGWTPGTEQLSVGVVGPARAGGAGAGIELRALDALTGAPLVGVRLRVDGEVVVGVSSEGALRATVAAGVHEVAIEADGHGTVALGTIELPAGCVRTVASRLVPDEAVARVEVVVETKLPEGSIAKLLEERRASTSVTDAIGAEQIAKTGDTTAAAALRRVPGLTLVNGRYVYVRGLGERYTSTQLNGALMPSPEPERRVVPLDLFPVAALESIVVQKSYTPDQPGEFGGGAVQIRTRAFPTAPVVRLVLQGGFRGGTTLAEGLRYDGGRTDFLGVDDGTRALPAEVRAASDDARLQEGGRFSETGYTPQQLEAFGESLQDVWTPTARRLPPDAGAQVTLGNGFHVGGRPGGALLTLQWGDAWWTDRYRAKTYSVGSEEPDTDYAFVRTERTARLAGTLSLGFEPAEGHVVRATTMVLRTTEDEARVFSGYLDDEQFDIRATRLRWQERMLILQQLSGEHGLGKGGGGPQLTWRYQFAQAGRHEPDTRLTRYDEATPGLLTLSRRDGDADQRQFSELRDRIHDAFASVAIPFGVRGVGQGKVKLGAAFTSRSRHVDTRRYSFLAAGEVGDDVRARAPEQIFTPEHIGPDAFQLTETTSATDNYVATQAIAAGFAMAEIPAARWLDVMAGARVEWSDQHVSTYALFDPDGVSIPADLEKLDVLPAASLTFRPRTDVAVRASYGRTLSRPDFRELSPALWQDVVGGRDEQGNRDLQRATLDNVDLRVEWFPERRDVIALGGFAKVFHQAIESTVLSGSDPTLTYLNARSAHDVGGELEVTKHLGFLHDALDTVWLGLNVALIRSRVDLGEDAGGVQTNTVRPLQGQSPWVVNAQLGWEDPRYGLSGTLLYNAQGPRIVEVGTFGLPDAYEQPFHALDAILGAQLPRGFELQLAGRNLLDQRSVIRLASGELMSSRRPGWSIGLQLGWHL